MESPAAAETRKAHVRENRGVGSGWWSLFGRLKYRRPNIKAPSSASSGKGAIQPLREITKPISGMPRIKASDQPNSVTAIANPRRS
jgi:hypothetical protein